MNLSPQSNSPLLRVTRLFAERYGSEPTALVRSPGRVNLIGEHTDYNGGYVLPLATDAALLFAARPRNDQQLRVFSATMGDAFSLSLDAPVQRAEPGWSNYLRGVLAGFQKRGVKIPGLDLFIDATLPLGGGLSSSAALEVGFATVLEQLTNTKLPLVEKALLCQQAEHEFAGTPCGIMDQFAVTFGQRGFLLLLDCETRQMQQIPMASEDVTLLVVNTMVKHTLSNGEYAVRRQQCHEAAAFLKVSTLCELTPEQFETLIGRLPDTLFRRARHVVHENARTKAAVEALRQNQWATLGQLMYASHASLRDDYAVSCSELDALVEIARNLGEPNGVYGCRMTGGGFGGCVVTLVKSSQVGNVSKTMRERYRAQTGLDPAILITRPADGVTVLDLAKPPFKA